MAWERFCRLLTRSFTSTCLYLSLLGNYQAPDCRPSPRSEGWPENSRMGEHARQLPGVWRCHRRLTRRYRQLVAEAASSKRVHICGRVRSEGISSRCRAQHAPQCSPIERSQIRGRSLTRVAGSKAGPIVQLKLPSASAGAAVISFNKQIHNGGRHGTELFHRYSAADRSILAAYPVAAAEVTPTGSLNPTRSPRTG